MLTVSEAHFIAYRMNINKDVLHRAAGVIESAANRGEYSTRCYLDKKGEVAEMLRHAGYGVTPCAEPNLYLIQW